jgi:hypothetical protein
LQAGCVAAFVERAAARFRGERRARWYSSRPDAGRSRRSRRTCSGRRARRIVLRLACIGAGAGVRDDRQPRPGRRAWDALGSARSAPCWGTRTPPQPARHRPWGCGCGSLAPGVAASRPFRERGPSGGGCRRQRSAAPAPVRAAVTALLHSLCVKPPDVLVLGVGGTLGEAWLSGFLAGAGQQGGIDFRQSAHFVGTSAGSIVAARLAAGRLPRRPGEAAGLARQAPPPSVSPARTAFERLARFPPGSSLPAAGAAAGPDTP